MPIGSVYMHVLEENGTKLKIRFSKDSKAASMLEDVEGTCSIGQPHRYYGITRRLGFIGLDDGPLATTRLLIGVL